MRFGCLVLIISIGLIWGGGQGVYTSIKNSSPTELSCAEYLEQKPNAEWLHLKKCSLNVLNASHEEKYGSILHLYIPLSPVLSEAEGEEGEKKNEKKPPVQILLKTKDEGFMNTYKQLSKLKDASAQIQFLVKNRKKLFPEQDVEGLLAFGINEKSSSREKLRELNENLAEDFVIIEHHDRPTGILASLVMLLAGLGILGFKLSSLVGGAGSKGEKSDGGRVAPVESGGEASQGRTEVAPE